MLTRGTVLFRLLFQETRISENISGRGRIWSCHQKLQGLGRLEVIQSKMSLDILSRQLQAKVFVLRITMIAVVMSVIMEVSMSVEFAWGLTWRRNVIAETRSVVMMMWILCGCLRYRLEVARFVIRLSTTWVVSSPIMMAFLFACHLTVPVARHDARLGASMCATGVLATTGLLSACAGSKSTPDEILVDVLSHLLMGNSCVRHII